MQVENPKVFMNLPTACFTDVLAPIYYVAFNIKDGEMFPFKIENSPEGLAFVNNPDSWITHFDAVNAMIQQFVFSQRKQFFRFKHILSTIKNSAYVRGQTVEARFNKKNVRDNQDVAEHFFKMLGNEEIKHYFKPIMEYWLASANDDTLCNVLFDMYADVISSISKVSIVAHICSGKRDNVEDCVRISEVIAANFEFNTSEGSSYYDI